MIKHDYNHHMTKYRIHTKLGDIPVSFVSHLHIKMVFHHLCPSLIKIKLTSETIITEQINSLFKKKTVYKTRGFIEMKQQRTH